MSYRNRVTPQNRVVTTPGDGSPGVPARPESRLLEPSRELQEVASGASLETTAKSVRHLAGRADRYRWQRHAAKLMKGEGRVGLCRWSVISKTAGVDLVSSSYGDGGDRAHYEGLQTCGSVWACPCCSARISETRREEMNTLLSWARAQGYQVSMLTLTARHGRDDDLGELLTAMKDAKQRWARHRAYRRIKPQMIGSVTATEVTGGGSHGWHPHFHVIFITDKGIDLSPLRDAWLASLRGAGLEGTGSGWDMRDAAETGRYIAKWGAAEELALTNYKKGRSGRTPAQLLAASSDEGDRRAGMLWSEYAEVFKGRRQLVWSRGLKVLAEIGEVADEEAAQDQAQDGQLETGRANISHELWRSSVADRRADRRSTVQDRAEQVGVEAATAELRAGHVAEPDAFEGLIDPDNEPRPGGLAAVALALVRPPPDIGDPG